jgi:hypothetical protein
MKTQPLFILLGLITLKTHAFCGFYVAKADASLFNKTSQVILVRDGLHTVITMQSDFKGKVKDFAMVVPVPTVLQRSDIRVVSGNLFQQLDAYSAPRLVEYWDENPCYRYDDYSKVMEESAPAPNRASSGDADKAMKKNYQVTIKAQYQIGEYDVLILDAKESKGLENWLIDHGYKIPKGASEVLYPYIQSNMKFFVVKVNLSKLENESQPLRPIQIRFESRKFMLPIRLGMANAHDDQDMIIYCFTRNGRVECTNYRNVEMPTDKNVPEFTQDVFGKFYAALFKRTLRREGKNNIFLEYAWDISGWNNMKCDPCAFEPPSKEILTESGVDWLRTGRWGNYEGEVFFTRMHVRYDRQNFPQDLQFQETSDKRNFQCRYIITHPALGPFECSEGKRYEKEVYKRREKELIQLALLTGWNVTPYTDYIKKWQDFDIHEYEELKTGFIPSFSNPNDSASWAALTNLNPSGIIEKRLYFFQINEEAFAMRGDDSSSFALLFGVICIGLFNGVLWLGGFYKQNKNKPFKF